jgi:hypothetical protein
VFFRAEQEAWNPSARLLALVLCLGPVIAAGIMAHAGEDPAGPNPHYRRGGDLIQFWGGGALLAEGATPEEFFDTESFRRRLNRVDPEHPPPHYTPAYPPPTYQMFRPLGRLDYPLASKILLWGLLLPFGLGCALLVRSAGYRRGPGLEAGLLLWCSPTAQLAISTGQLSGLWVCMLGGGVLLWSRGRRWLGGAVLGLLCMKPTLAAPVVLALALAGQWRALGGFALGGAGLLVWSVAAGGEGLWLAYLKVLAEGPGLTQSLWINPARQFTFRTLLACPFEGSELAVPLGMAGTLAGLSLALWMRWRVRGLLAEAPDSLAALAVLLSASAFASPHVYDYDLGLHFPLLIWAALHVHERKAVHPRAGLLLCIGFFLSPLLLRLSGLLDFSLGSLLLLSVLIWAGMEMGRVAARHQEDVGRA